MGNLDKQTFIEMCTDGPCSHYDYRKQVKTMHKILKTTCFYSLYEQ